MIFDNPDRVRVRNAVLALTTLAWVFLCTRFVWSPGMPHAHARNHAASHDAVSISGAADGILMLAAMMAPTLIPPIQFVRANGLARRRARSTLLFVSGYTTVWIFAGALIMWVAAALASFVFPQSFTVAAAFSIALIWQCSPAKQSCLNRCHQLRALAAIGREADIDALFFGASQGIWCAGSCWALMLLPMLLPQGHVVAMAIATLLIFSERLEPPKPRCWRWRGPEKALRILIAQTRMRLRAKYTPEPEPDTAA